mgnify:CR=1 FL=1
MKQAIGCILFLVVTLIVIFSALYLDGGMSAKETLFCLLFVWALTFCLMLGLYLIAGLI